MSKPAGKLAKKPASKPRPKDALPDRGEAVSEMEPLVMSESSAHRPRLNELVFELVSAATGFKASLPDGMVEALSDVVRSMNCYYSNLIEGHNTHPIEIERALCDDYSTNNEQRNLQYSASIRRSHKQKTAPEPHTGLQGEGGDSGHQGRPDAGVEPKCGRGW